MNHKLFLSLTTTIISFKANAENIDLNKIQALVNSIDSKELNEEESMAYENIKTYVYNLKDLPNSQYITSETLRAQYEEKFINFDDLERIVDLITESEIAPRNEQF